MKKLLAILLAAIMLLSLAACTSNDDNPSGSENNPGTSQSDNQGGENSDGGEENNGGEESGTKTFSWPTADYIKDYMKYNGSGTIVMVTNESALSDYPYTIIHINGATLADIEAYISTLKANGFEYHPTAMEIIENAGEPAFEFGGYDSSFSWQGQLEGTGYIGLKIRESATSGSELVGSEVVEFTYNLRMYITTEIAEQGKVFVY